MKIGPTYLNYTDSAVGGVDILYFVITFQNLIEMFYSTIYHQGGDQTKVVIKSKIIVFRRCMAIYSSSVLLPVFGVFSFISQTFYNYRLN